MSKHEQNMTEINKRVAAAMDRAMVAGRDPKEALASYLAEMKSKYPPVFAAYCRWMGWAA